MIGKLMTNDGANAVLLVALSGTGRFFRNGEEDAAPFLRECSVRGGRIERIREYPAKPQGGAGVVPEDEGGAPRYLALELLLQEDRLAEVRLYPVYLIDLFSVVDRPVEIQRELPVQPEIRASAERLCRP